MPRTKLTPTDPEPACDIAAQFEALAEPLHPKRAMWVSVGTPLPPLSYPRSLECVVFDDTGMLIAGMVDIYRLRDDSSEEQLAAILGYVESKNEALGASLPFAPLVVQARIGNAVVLEMLSSPARFREAARRCREHGDVHVMTMEACLRRRQRLIEEEGHAKRLQGRKDREQAEARVSR